MIQIVDEIETLIKKEDVEKLTSRSALETLNLLIDLHPKFWKGKADLIIHIVCEISKTKSFPNTIRESALELVYSLCESSPKAVKKSENFKKEFLPLLFELLMEVDNINNLEQWEKQVEEDEND